ncbi:MAG: NAD(P)/FAD-dependent oxidoreductase [Gemmataceae bacterium]
MAEQFDAVVIGGGPGGSTAALLLARAGWAVALVERKSFPRRKVCGEYLSATNLPLLAELGLADEFCRLAGPEVREVGLFAGPLVLRAALPRPGNGGWGRALGRESLDTLLLQRARAAGANVFQPATAREMRDDGEQYDCRVSAEDGSRDLRAPVVIAAHGFWEAGPLPTQPTPSAGAASDLLGFKAHFTGARLADGLMPLLAFPGGYGGMVHTDGGRVSLSCCIRRARLSALRHGANEDAGEVVLRHIASCCRGVRDALDGADRGEPWLAAGPLRPGIRVCADGGVYRVGNAAGEAHPAIAEGISMAMQSSWLLTRRLIAGRPRTRADRHAIGAGYAADWRRNFAPRLRAAALFAHWAMRPMAVRITRPLLKRCPAILSWCAGLSGKARQMV